MQIVKTEQNSQPRKDEETYLRKYESPRKHGTKVKKHPNSRAPFSGEALWGIPWPVDNMGVPARSNTTFSQKKRLGKRERTMTRFQGPARVQNTSDDDDDDDDDSDDVNAKRATCNALNFYLI